MSTRGLFNVLAVLAFAIGLILLLTGEGGLAAFFLIIVLMLGVAGAIAELRLQIKQIETDLIHRVYRLEQIVVGLSNIMNIKETENQENENKTT